MVQLSHPYMTPGKTIVLENAAGRKSHLSGPLMKAFIGRSLSGRTPGERGDKGSLRGMRGGGRFYSQGRCLSWVFPYKEKSAGYSNGWCLRAPCRYLIGPGCPTFHIALTRWNFVGKVMSLLFSMLSRLVITFFQGVSDF